MLPPIVGPPGAEDPPRALVGRLRRWRANGPWGFIFSELHNCDIFFDGSECESAASLTDGDFVLFELDSEAQGLPEARNARKAEPAEVERQQALLAQTYQQVARTPLVPELPPGDRLPTNAPGAGAEGWFQGASPAGGPRPHAALGQGAEAGSGVASQPMSLPPHLDGMQGRRGGLPPPPPPAHPAPATPEAFVQHNAQAYMGHPAYGGYVTYGEDGQWQTSSGVSADALLGQQVPMVEHAAPAVRLLLEGPPMLDRLNPKALVSVLTGGTWTERHAQSFPCSRTGVATQVGREYAQILQETREVLVQQGEDMDHGMQGDWWSWYTPVQAPWAAVQHR